jgi:hypothetical protein
MFWLESYDLFEQISALDGSGEKNMPEIVKPNFMYCKQRKINSGD